MLLWGAIILSLIGSVMIATGLYLLLTLIR